MNTLQPINSHLLADEEVMAIVEPVTIPTYPVGVPNRNPMFLEKRVYQGSSGVVYPHPVIESVGDAKQERTYTGIWLENRYLRILLLPELGGRVQMAYDKVNDHHFVYYNQVIKPALVGLTGPWISGGIEFNWPQHHRPSTFLPVDYRIEEQADGSKIVWLGEWERMFRTQSVAGFRLYPDRAVLEISVQLYNSTPLPQTFLWWANPAVSVDDDYQSVFPPDVTAVMDHGKRAVSTFPIATGVYYKVDYAPGTDISRYKNIPVPTSYMAYHSDYDFLGCYHHDRQVGMLHVANHHLVPGKKQWTWGNGDFGRAWDRQLTDEDGPYIELMCGAFTDNQPDFSWLQPGEEKRFTQIFLPYISIGAVKNASSEAALNLEIDGDRARIGVYCSRPRRVRVRLTAHSDELYAGEHDLSPAQAFVGEVLLPAGLPPAALRLAVLDGDCELLAWSPPEPAATTPPAPAAAAAAPQAIESNEELFLNGLHLEQYRHATYAPEAYYLEALRRDPLDSRCNNALGRLLLRRGQFAAAEAYLRTAVQSLTRRNPNPYDGEPYYNLGLALRMQGRYAAAYDAFYKAAWNAAWQDAAYFELARLACRRENWAEALAHLDEALARNGRHHGARHLRVAVLRRLRRGVEAAAAAVQGLALDRLNYGLHYESSLLQGNDDYRALLQDNVHTYLELALAYAHAGLFDEAVDLLLQAPPVDPMLFYYLGWVHQQAGDEDAAALAFGRAAALPPDYCFPNQYECVAALQAAMRCHPADPRAPYYLGNFWYAHRCHDDAIAAWEQARRLDPGFPTVHRNLGIAYVNQRGDLAQARQCYAAALALDPTDARVLFEADQLAKKLGAPPAERLAALAEHADLVAQRDDLTVEYVALLNLTGDHAAALARLLARTFHPWEGGEGKVMGQYVAALVELARQQLAAGSPAAAIDYLERARVYPHNLGEGKLPGARENQIDYWLGRAYAQMGEAEKAQQHFTAAATGSVEPAAALYYNDQPPDMILYQALAKAELGARAEAAAIAQGLVNYGSTQAAQTVTVDYFAVSLPDFLVFDDDLPRRHRLHCEYMLGLGYLGLGDIAAASACFDRVLAEDPAHLGAVLHRRLALATDNTLPTPPSSPGRFAP
jgi:tetratricopeptide (TPR) repeat protein